MKGTAYNNRHDATENDLDNTEITKADAIKERSQDIIGEGVVRGLEVTLNTDLTFNIEAGVGYDSNGERIDVKNRIDNLNLASLAVGVTNFIAIAYRDLETTDRPNPITGILSSSRREASFNPKAVLTFDTTPAGSPPIPRNLDEFGNPLVLLATIIPDSAGGGNVDNTVRTLVLTTTGNLEALQIQIDANKSDADTTKAEVVAARLDSDRTPIFHGSLFAHLSKFWSRFIGHEDDFTNPHKVDLTQAQAAGGFVSASGLGPDVLNPSNPLPLYKRTGNRTIQVDAGQVVINGSLRANSSTLVLDLNTVGLNGIDVSPLGTNVWYYMYALADSIGSAGWSVIASQSEVKPQVFPSGFADPNFRLIGYLNLDGSGNIRQFVVDGSHYWDAAFRSIESKTVTNSLFTVDLNVAGKRFAPQGIRHAYFQFTSVGTQSDTVRPSLQPLTTTDRHIEESNGLNGGFTGSFSASTECPLDPSTTPSPRVHWKINSNGGPLDNAVTLHFRGFTTHL